MNRGYNRYQSFGMRQEWLRLFIQKGENWIENTPLGNRQVQGFQKWLIDAGLWYRRKPTPLGEVIIRHGDASDSCLWLMLWASLSYNSPLINWYAYSIPNGVYTKADLTQMLALIQGKSEPNRTDVNAISALINTFKTTPLGDTLGFGKITTDGGQKIIIKAVNGEKTSPLALISAIILYRKSHHISEVSIQSLLYSNPLSPCRLFQIPDEIFPALCQVSAQEYPEYLSCYSQENLDYLRIQPDIDIDNIFLTL